MRIENVLAYAERMKNMMEYVAMMKGKKYNRENMERMRENQDDTK